MVKGSKMTRESRNKMSLSKMGIKLPVFTESHKLKISQAMLGNKNGACITAEESKKRGEKIKGENNVMFGKSPIKINPYKPEGLDHIVRSSYEEKVFLFLKTNGIEYEYEPLRFFIKHEEGNMTYAVDARIKNTNIFIEVKGWCDPVSELKMREFRRQYPENELWVVTSKKGIKNIPQDCFDKIFDVERLDGLLSAVQVVKAA